MQQGDMPRTARARWKLGGDSIVARLPFTSGKTGVIVNTGFRLSTRVIKLVSGALVGVLIGRAWGVDALGLYTSLAVLTGLFEFAFDFGQPGLLIRKIAYDPADARGLLSTTAALLPFGWLVGIGLALAGAALMLRGVDGLVPAVLGACLWMMAGAANFALAALFLATGRMGYETRATFIERVAMLPLVAVVCLGPPNIAALFGAMALARLLAVAINLKTVSGIVGSLRPDWNARRMVDAARAGVPFWTHNLFTLLYKSQSVLILNALATIYAVGLFRSAGVLVLQLPVLAIAYNESLFPGLMRHYVAGDRGALHRGIRASVLIMTLIGAAAAAVLIVGAEPILTALYGDAFRPAAPGLAILALGVPFSFANNSLGMYLTIVNRQRDRATLSAVGAAIGVGLNVLLIPQFGFVGAAIAVSVTEVLVVAALLVMWWRSMRSDFDPGATPGRVVGLA